MNRILVPLEANPYSIFVANSLHSLEGALKKGIPKPARALVVTHPFLKDHYGPALKKCLEQSGLKVQFAILPSGEQIKNLKTVQDLYKKCDRAGLDRNSYLIAFGGGVLGDTVGFVAATYLRGIPLIQFPTTLLAMVDSSIGGKVGVDLESGKNLVGAFYQPKLVGCALSTLETLPVKEYRNGLAEVIKYGVIGDSELFETLEKEIPEKLNLEWIVLRCAKIKATVVSKDEKEKKGVREILNFGHTIGHALETITGYREYKHGEAIALGMCAAGFMAKELKLWDVDSLMRLEKLISCAGLPTQLTKRLPSMELLKLLFHDKKTLNQKLRFVLPKKIGKVIVKEVPTPLALAGINHIQNY